MFFIIKSKSNENNLKNTVADIVVGHWTSTEKF